MLKKEGVRKNNGKLPHLFIPSKTATLVPEFAVDELPLGITAASVPEFAMKDLPLGRTLMMRSKLCVTFEFILFKENRDSRRSESNSLYPLSRQSCVLAQRCA